MQFGLLYEMQRPFKGTGGVDLHNRLRDIGGVRRQACRRMRCCTPIASQARPTCQVHQCRPQEQKQ